MSHLPQPITCGEALMHLLASYGVDTLFGIPGVHTVELYRGLPQTPIRHITPRHEQGAGFMADGYARASGKPGVCLVITGPGLTNILTAMAQAYADSIPMLVISSVNRRHELSLGEGRLHELPQQRALSTGVCAFSHTLLCPDELPAVLARAFSVFKSARPRPVHIEIPLDVMTAPASHLPLQAWALPERPKADPQQLAAAARLMAQAVHPLLLIGGGCVEADAATVIRLAETWKAPVCHTINSKGLIPPNHPLSLGCNQSLPPVRALAAQADVILAVGTELGETDYDVVFDGGFRLNGRLIRIDIDPEQLHRNHPADMAIVGDAADALWQLSQLLPDIPVHSASPYPAVAAAKTQLSAMQPKSWLPLNHLLQSIATVWPDAVVVGDSTQPVYAGNHLFEPARIRSWFNSSTGYGTLGYGLPAAIGAKLAVPERPVVCLVGDGGLQFTLPELASAVEAGTPVIVVLWNNQGYGEIKSYMQKHQIATIGVDLYTPDFQQLAQGFGCAATLVRHREELLPALQQADSERPTVIEIQAETFGLACRKT